MPTRFPSPSHADHIAKHGSLEPNPILRAPPLNRRQRGATEAAPCFSLHDHEPPVPVRGGVWSSSFTQISSVTGPYQKFHVPNDKKKAAVACARTEAARVFPLICPSPNYPVEYPTTGRKMQNPTTSSISEGPFFDSTARAGYFLVRQIFATSGNTQILVSSVSDMDVRT